METIIKRNDRKIIQCDRCGGTFYKLDNLRRHLNKKKNLRTPIKRYTNCRINRKI